MIYRVPLTITTTTLEHGFILVEATDAESAIELVDQGEAELGDVQLHGRSEIVRCDVEHDHFRETDVEVAAHA